MAGENSGQADQPVPENYEDLLDDYSHFAPPAADEGWLVIVVIALLLKSEIILPRIMALNILPDESSYQEGCWLYIPSNCFAHSFSTPNTIA